MRLKDDGLLKDEQEGKQNEYYPNLDNIIISRVYFFQSHSKMKIETTLLGYT